jgi:excisionase family DNA binding protein
VGSLWTVAEVAAYLRVSRSWLYHRSAAGLLPCLRVGALLRFDPDAIRAYAQGQGHQDTNALILAAKG